MHNAKLKIIFAVASLILIGIVIFHTFFSHRDILTPRIRRELKNILNDSAKKYGTPGMMIGVWAGSEEWIGENGLANTASQDKMRATHQTRIGSITKTFTGTVILQLADEGKLSLYDSLAKYCPNIPDSKKISIRQLLTMTSGIHSYTEIQRIDDEIAEDKFRVWTHEELVKAAVSSGPDFSPGKSFHYSNTNTILLGMIIEKVTGNSVSDEITKRIITKLGLKNTYFPKTTKFSGTYIHGYFEDEKTKKLDDWSEQNVSWAWTADAMISNMYDLKKYGKALTDGTFLHDALQCARLTEWIPVEKPGFKSLKYGLGIANIGGFIGHNGEIPGYITGVFHSPEKDTTIVIVSNIYPRGEAILEITKRIIKLIYPKTEV